MILKGLATAAVKAALVEGIVISMKSMTDEPQDIPPQSVLPEIELKTEPYKLGFIFVCGVLVGAGLGLRVKPVMVFR